MTYEKIKLVDQNFIKGLELMKNGNALIDEANKIMGTKTVNQEFVIECERILAMAKAGECQRMACILVRDTTGDRVDFYTSKGVGLMWLVGMLNQYIHSIMTGVIK